MADIKIEVDFIREDRGFCRMYYRERGGHKRLLCLQEDQRNEPPKLYSCSEDGEPYYEVSGELVIIETKDELHF